MLHLYTGMFSIVLENKGR